MHTHSIRHKRRALFLGALLSTIPSRAAAQADIDVIDPASAKAIASLPPLPVNHVALRPEPDSARTVATALSWTGFVAGGTIAGLDYIVQHFDFSTCTSSSAPGSEGCGARAHPANGALFLYGSVVSVVPNIPRVVMGDGTGGLLFTVASGASVAIAGAVRPSDTTTAGWSAFLLGFLAPVTLGIVSLATTPESEGDGEKEHAARVGFAPVPIVDARGTHGGALTIVGVF